MTKFICTSNIHSNNHYNYHTYQLVINRREKVGIEKLKNPQVFIDYSQTINFYENLEDYNPMKKRKVLIVFDDMIADTESDEKLSPIVT